MPFADKKTAIKGSIGEGIVDRHLIAKGLIPYRPALGDVAHPFDRLFAALDKKTIFIGDTKSKPAREYYPDTGINFRHYLIYKYAHSHHSLDTYLSFVDEKQGQIYGQFLSVLDRTRAVRHGGRELWYPRSEHNRFGEIRYFPLIAMETIGPLSTDECGDLKAASTRNPNYDAPELQLKLFNVVPRDEDFRPLCSGGCGNTLDDDAIACGRDYCFDCYCFQQD